MANSIDVVDGIAEAAYGGIALFHRIGALWLFTVPRTALFALLRMTSFRIYQNRCREKAEMSCVVVSSAMTCTISCAVTGASRMPSRKCPVAT